MQGVIDIEKIFHLMLSARSVVEGKRYQRKEGEPLIGGVDNGEKSQGNGNADQLGGLIGRRENEDGRKNTPNAVVHAVIRRGEEMGKNLDQKDGRDQGEGKQQPRFDAVLFHRAVECVD